MNKGKKKKHLWQKKIGMIISFLIGATCGVLAGRYISATLSEGTLAERLISLAVLIGGIIITLYLQTIIHEAGHLVFGLLTGYKFSSFLLGSLLWVKENGQIKLKKMPMPGISGQCLMIPPEMINGKFPSVLYNLGGVFFNAITGLLFLGLAAICRDIPYLTIVLLTISVIGFAYVLMNGIPLRLGTINNDGHNVMSLGKSNEAAHSFWMQLHINGQIAKGIRLKDMPAEWFYMPSDDKMENSMIAVMGVSHSNRLMDMHSFEEVYQLMNKIVEMDSAIVGLHRNLMNCDRIYCELIGANRREQLDLMLDKQQKAFMKSMKNFLPVIRTEYAYALLAEKDTKKAEKIKQTFEKRALSYPYQSDIESERELINIVEAALISNESAF